ncbi:MAG: carbohydrate ABC transporter permease [Microbacteriaceae bacterium]
MRSRSQEIKRFLVFALIPLAIFTIVLLVPFIRGVYFSFTDWNGFDVTKFVGLDNYIESFHDQAFWASLLLTLMYVAVSLVLVNLVAFGLALLVTLPVRGVNVLRTTFFVPNLIGGVILGLIWQFLFGQALPVIAANTGLPIFQENWLLNTQTAFWAMVIVTVWQMSGYMMIIYVTALMGIERDVVEAAYIDGANNAQTLWYIKLPLMAQAFTISLFLTMRNAFMAYDLNLALTGGNPYRTTELISLRVFREAFGFGHFSTGQAQAVIMFVVIAVAALAQVIISKRMEVQR